MIEVTLADIELWQRNGWIVDLDNYKAYKRIPNLSGEGVQDYITAWLPQWKAARHDNDGATEEPPF